MHAKGAFILYYRFVFKKIVGMDTYSTCTVRQLEKIRSLSKSLNPETISVISQNSCTALKLEFGFL